MTDPLPSEDITVSSDRSLKKLAWAIEESVGQFKLILARCNYGSLRSRLVDRLQELCSVEIRVLVLKESDKILYATIRAALGENMPAALMVLGLESVRDIDQMLTSSNQVREEFRKNFPFPLVLWVNDQVLKNLMRLASDFESWATTVTFVISSEDLENQLRDTAEQWFTNNLTLTLEACLELEAAYKELLKDERGSNPELAADCESLLGFAKRVNNQINAAIEHYRIGLVFWQQTNNLERQAKLLDEIAFCYYLKAPTYRHRNQPICQDTQHYVQDYLRVIEQIKRPDLMANSILRFSEVLGYLQDWEQLKRLAKQALTRHEAENKPIELARDYGFLAEAALAQERWKEANQFAQKALEVLSITSKIQSPGSGCIPILQKDQVVRASCSRTPRSEQDAHTQRKIERYLRKTGSRTPRSEQDAHTTDLQKWDAPPGSSGVVYELPDKSVLLYDPSLYLFILAKSQQSLGQSPEAILNLEVAREVGSPECDPQLYIDILCHLQKLYFKEKDYLKAFEIKQKRQSIEQQYGLRAFIGAGRIQSQRQARLALKQVVETREIASLQESVAPEITASGRQLDVERLIERIARNDCKLIVIHGQSGVGKSSLVTGGLVPALKQKVIGTSDVLPVLVRVYTNWVGELGRLLAEALEEKGIEEDLVRVLLQTTLSHSDPPKSPLKKGTLTDLSNLDPPKSPLKRGTLTEFSPLFKGGWGGSAGLQTRPRHESNSASLDLVAGILEELQQSESRNLRTVLIFDQFEEFFFVYPDPVHRRQFFEFVGECLNILPVKVILSLREDYLHYLLECNYLDSMKIIGNDILTKNVLYPLGNFLPADAKSIIQRLTERSYFHLEPALVEELVQDLAGEMGQVRPIELQIVGAQLQTENITTLTQYRECGQKVELVKRYLAEVVKDCGAENQQVAELVLYLLTDEKGTRPLKTRAEVERDLQALASADLSVEANQLDLVFKIFVDSGLVVLLPELPADRYQLVHDYLAAFIRQQQEPRLNELIAELNKEREQRQKAEAQRHLTEEELKRAEQSRQILAEANQKAQRRIRIGSAVLLAAVTALIWAGRVVGNAHAQRKEADSRAEVAKREESQAKAKLETTNREAAQANQNLKAVQNNLIKANQQVQQIKQEVDKAKKAKQEAEVKTQQVNQNLKGVQDNLIKANQQVQQAKQAVTQAEKTKREAETRTQQANQNLKAAQDKLTAANQQVQQAKQEVANAKAELATIDQQAKEQLLAATQKVKSAEEQAEKAQQAVTEAKQVEQQLQEEAEKARQELAHRATQLNNLNTQLNLLNRVQDDVAASIQDTLITIEQQTRQKPAVIYVTLGQKDDDQLGLWLVTAKGSLRKQVPGTMPKQVVQVAAQFRSAVTDVRNSVRYLAPAQQLYGWMIKPLEDDLHKQGINNLVFLMDSGLRSLPLAALHDGKSFLVEKYSIGLMPGLTLTDNRHVDIKNASVLAMGVSESRQGLKPLPAVPVELSTIMRLWRGKSFLNEEFTFDNLKLQRQKQPFQIIHLATGAEFRPGNPDGSYILLWDNKLRLDQLEQLGWYDPPVELLVLSTCNSGLGDEHIKYGFAGSAVQSGVKSVLGSLWSVSDEGTLGLMAEFYSQLRRAPIKAEALRQAQVAMLKGQVRLEGGQLRTLKMSIPLPLKQAQLSDRDFSHPYYWSGFTMIGNPW